MDTNLIHVGADKVGGSFEALIVLFRGFLAHVI